MAQNAKLKVEFELTGDQKKILGLLVAREKIPAGEVCRRLLVNHLNICRDAALTGVLPHVPQEPKPLPPSKRSGRKPAPSTVLRGAEQYRLGPRTGPEMPVALQQLKSSQPRSAGDSGSAGLAPPRNR